MLLVPLLVVQRFLNHSSHPPIDVDLAGHTRVSQVTDTATMWHYSMLSNSGKRPGEIENSLKQFGSCLDVKTFS